MSMLAARHLSDVLNGIKKPGTPPAPRGPRSRRTFVACEIALIEVQERDVGATWVTHVNFRSKMSFLQSLVPGMVIRIRIKGL